MTKARALLSAAVVAALAASCAPAAVPSPTAADAQAFVTEAEARLFALRQDAMRTAWLRETSLDAVTRTAAAAADAALTTAAADLARGAARFDGLELPTATARKLTLLRARPLTIAPGNPALAEELADLVAALERTYGAGGYCWGAGRECLDRTALQRTVAELRDTDRLLDLWDDGRVIASSMRSRYERMVRIANAGAIELGHVDAGDRWRSAYDQLSEPLPTELERLWSRIRPLYESLHCHVRGALADEYGTAIAPPGEAIPAHLLGDLGDGRWSSVYDLVAPNTRRRAYDATRQLERNRVEPLDMVRYAEGFLVSLGFDSLPATFWERSLFVRPSDREVLCRPRAWNIDGENDPRLTMCLEVTGDDLAAVHRELARTYYRWSYRSQAPLLRSAANDVLLEAAGEAVAFSVTPAYLVELDLLDRAPGDAYDIPFLLRKALDEIAALPFALLVDRWRWQVFAGAVRPDRYNQAWWELRRTYQGVRPPLPRSEADFDPGSTHRVAANTPSTRDFLAGVVRYQLHRALCAAAGNDGPLHRCSIFGSPSAGEQLRNMMQTEASRPWPEALEMVTGTRQVDASALLDYYAPLADWLDERNARRSCGW